MPLAEYDIGAQRQPPTDIRITVLRRRIRASSEPVERLIADLAFGLRDSGLSPQVGTVMAEAR